MVRRRPWILRAVREIFYRCATPLQKGYWFIFRPYRPGVKTFVFYDDKLLLVRLGYAHKKWVLPGGGINWREASHDAAIREVKEESGFTISNVALVGKKFHTTQYKKVTVFYYTTTICEGDITIDGQEIIDAGWFSLQEPLPEHMPRLREEIEMYNTWKYAH